MVLGKAVSRQGAFQYETVGVFWRLLRREGCSKGASLKIMKIENGTLIQFFIKSRYGEPLNTVPGAGWKKHAKNKNEISIEK